MSWHLDRFCEIWAVDFEFIARDGERPWPVCLVAWELRSNRKVYLWRDRFGPTAPYSTGPDSLFVSFQAAAELACHLVLGWPKPAAILDLYAEYRWLTNGLTSPESVSLLNTLFAFDIEGISKAEKTAGRDLVLRGGPWSRDECKTILAYCETDVVALTKLLPKIVPLLDLPRALLRGSYMGAVAAMEHVGTPVDVELWERLMSRWSTIKLGLIDKVDSAYGVYENGSFSTKKFIAYLNRHGIPWPLLESGEPELTDKVFEERANTYPQLRELRYLRDVLDKLRLSSFTVGQDGFNRAWLRPFWTVTGRNQPSPAKFIFAAPSWLRGLIKPPPGFGLCYLDWVQQEFGIAGAMSCDSAMKTAYMSGDSYLWFAKEAGGVPPDATKESHELEREQFKQCTLGTQYEIGDRSLAIRIQQSGAAARRLLRLHKETFPQYWGWLNDAKNHSFIHARQVTVYGWQKRITESSCNHRAVGNFYSQGNGAEMLRLAAIFGTESGIQICAPVHDAVLIMAPLERLDADIEAMRAHMERASELVLDGFRLRTDAKDIRYPDRYSCKKGADMWAKVKALYEV